VESTRHPVTDRTQIFVRLLDEGVDVWRPVRAELVDDAVYRIVAQDYDRELETWEFEPGDRVLCEWVESTDGRILAAARRDE